MMGIAIGLVMRRFLRWLFGAPFEELPPEFGDSIPPELRVFEAKAEAMQRHPQGHMPDVHSRRARPAR